MNLGNNFPGPLLLSNPIVLDITGRDFKTEGPMPGWTWDGTNFNPPVEE
jgi:hypothetical protein